MITTENIYKLNLFGFIWYRCKAEKRAETIKNWSDNGGVLVISYEMFRNLTTNKAQSDASIEKYMVSPGAELAIFDEGHLLQSPKAKNYRAFDRIATHRRLILTGTPLQNNLIEYYWMFSFIKLATVLGPLKQFKKLFCTPIADSQKEEATPYAINFMKRRAYILQRLLSPYIYRVTSSLYKEILPAKKEYLLRIRLTDIQKKLYKVFFIQTSFCYSHYPYLNVYF